MMTEQEVVNVALINGPEYMEQRYTRNQLFGMYYTLVGSEFGRKSASKQDLAHSIHHYICTANRVAAFNGDRAYEVHTSEVDGLVACIKRNSDYTVAQYFPEDMLTTAYSQLFPNGVHKSKIDMVHQVRDRFKL